MASTDIDFAPQAKRRGIAGKIQDTKEFIYTSETGFLGRSCSSWAKITVFYTIFYSVLAGFFAASMAIFFTTIDGNYPKQSGMNSLLKGNPGMGFRPMPNVDSTLIRFEQGKEESYRLYADNIQAFLDQYENEKQTGENFIDCQASGRSEEQREKVCRYHLTELGNECTFQKEFGYDEGTPCVLLKLNKIYGWEPELYNNETSPKNMPKELVKELKGSPQGVMVTCEGENPADIENMGTYDVYPKSGFPAYFFPYLNQEGYRQPIVMVRFNNPKPGVVMQISCKAWAQNIKHNRNDRAGGVHFELMVD